MMSDPYKVLGVERTATKDEIKKAYKKLAQKHHPDRGGDEAKFKEATAAYDKIKDGKPYVKEDDFTGWQEYNEHFKHKSDIDIEEILRQAAKHKQQQKVRYTVPIELKDAVVGGKHFVRIPIGSEIQALEITIPAGVQDDDTIKYPRLAGGKDLYITFKVQPSKVWTIQGLDLIKVVKVNIWDLIKGVEVPVTTIYGTTIKIKIPKGTQPEAMMRVKGKGIQSRKNLMQVGDMYVHIQAVIPENIHEDILSAIYRTNS